MIISVLIPIHNERYNIEPLLERVLTAELPNDCRVEVVVVDDGSDDGSRERINAAAARHTDRIRVLTHDRRRGKGASVRAALAAARGDLCILQDGDLEFDPVDYGDLLSPILEGHADLVVGSRFFPHRWRRVPSYWRTASQRHLTTASNLVADLTLSDALSPFQAFRTELIRTIPLRSNGFNIVPELVIKAGKRGLRVFEVPVTFQGRTRVQGSKRRARDVLVDLLTIAKLAVVDDLYSGDIGDEILTDISRAHRFNRWMADAIRPWLGHRVLEIGAGIGNMTQQLLPRDHYLATDNEPRHLTVLRSLAFGKAHLEAQLVDASDPQHFADLAGRFDSVVCLNVLEHIADAETALGNMAAALIPGGRLVVLVPQGRWLYSPMDRALGHVSRYGREELRAAMQAAGLTIVRSYNFNRAGVPGWLLNGRLLRRRRMARIQLKIFDLLVPLWMALDRLLPWHGLSLVMIGERR